DDAAALGAEHRDLALLVAEDERAVAGVAAEDVVRVEVDPRELPAVGLEAHDDPEIRGEEAIALDLERTVAAARARVEADAIGRAGDGREALVARLHEERRAGQLANGERHVRRAAAGGLLDVVVEPEDADLAEVERVVLRPRAARLLAQDDAADLVAVREIDR